MSKDESHSITTIHKRASKIQSKRVITVVVGEEGVGKEREERK